MKLKLSNSREIRQSLSTVANLVLNDEISESKAKTFTYISNTILQAIKNIELEGKIETLEQIIDEYEHNR